MSTPSAADLRSRLPELSLRDEHRLRRRLEGIRKIRRDDAKAAALSEVAAEIEAGEKRLAARAALVPAITYPELLPVSQRKDDIAEAIRQHQVVIVAGETGSGKTTQLPKICLELGRGIRGVIGHTQPRRLAARTVAERIAEETKTELGDAVGYQVRFTRKAGDDTLVKLMTDGILLAELSQDRILRRYDTLIIDEAHERSLNIDFILGYLKQLLPRRPDLKVIITSATIDPERFAAHFDGAPIVEVSGRTYPVEIRYRPLVPDAGDASDDDEPRDQVQAIVEAVDELALEPPGDVLVFLSGEREIRDAADALRKRFDNTRHRGAETEILPLYARLSAAEQHRVFQPHRGRRIVLATNVAETSLTVPGIRYVVDPGTARISRYSHRTKVQRLPIEAISQASARQRAGRCGRVADGICIRLYSEEDFDSRPAFTDPEILRTNLASVILQMTALGLGDVAAFPFIDPPDRRSISAGVDLLHELGALEPKASDPRKRLTDVGRTLSQLPIDPRLGRMILEANRHGCTRDVIIIAAALSIQDPRERPAEHQQAADEKHARFRDPTSDFATLLNLWRYLSDEKRARSSNQFRKMCRNEFLNYLRIREWQDLDAQLRSLVKPLGVTVSDAPGGTKKTGASSAPDENGPAEAIHRSLLAGLLSHIGVKEGQGNEYLGARGTKFGVFPGSGLFKKPPRWVMSAELVETSRLWARINAQIDPEWAESLAEHLVKRSYSEPHWEKKAGAVMAYEKVTLYGVPIVASRKVQYAKIDPGLSRELFIRHALVEGDWETRHHFFHHNRELLEDVEDLEHRARRRDILVDDETLFEFYDGRIPAGIVSGRHFDSWWKKTRQQDPDLLTFSTELLINDEAGDVSAADYPDTWRHSEHELPLTYQFEPGSQADGVTVDVPLPVLNQVDASGFDWQVPGMREELITALIKSLPKQLRRSFVPAPDTARQVLARLGRSSSESDLTAALARELTRMRAVPVAPGDFDFERVPGHLRVTFRVVDENGRKVAENKDLAILKRELQADMRKTVSAAGASIERSGLREWNFGELPRTFETVRGGHPVTGYPSLVDQGDSAAIRVLHTEAEQRTAHWAGVRRLLLLSIPSPVAFVQRHLTNQTKLVLSQNPDGSVADLLIDCTECAADVLIADAGGAVWDEAGFKGLRERVRGSLIEQVFAVVDEVENALSVAHRVRTQLDRVPGTASRDSVTDARHHLEQLVHPGFVTATGRDRLAHLSRYLRALERRVAKMATSPERDLDQMDTIARVQDAYNDLLDSIPPDRMPTKAHESVRWMIEELTVSLFAQELGTAHPVSEKRVLRAISDLR
ncbi:ATP-dependent RNA helicase HrpA [Phytoactinopolyspora mesophila]|uniref:RNA helicase n=1 Tax=Phytoactinopolyspora mesophila TaxID=2650750 RepID=A0A7K3M6L1_9ACTN|nr:ATP-dependent RNA helicase HrpA [Phytoactinopolyspora mesophila]NDL58951.1 ATP-dependent RNA helicase HrpA [Phytoactinopolyspora mesophila]